LLLDERRLLQEPPWLEPDSEHDAIPAGASGFKAFDGMTQLRSKAELLKKSKKRLSQA